MVMICKNISRLLRSYAGHCDAALVSFSTTAATARKSPPRTPLISRYLIDSCGFSPDTAARTAKTLVHVKSLSNPESVIQFLKQSGLDDAQIRDLIPKRPLLLCADVENTLKPKVKALQQLGFSESELTQLIVSSPCALRYSGDLQPKIDFWRIFYGDNNDNLLRVIKRNTYLFSSSMDKRIMPNVSLLRSCGLTDSQIARLILKSCRLITRGTESIKELVRRAEELGVPTGSSMFYRALCSVSSISEAKMKAKIKVLRSLGGSEAEIKSGIQRCPSLLTLSEKKIQDTMNFLTKKVGCEPAYVFCRLGILCYSLEKRLIPRYYVLQTLKSKEIARGCTDFFSAIVLTDEKFISRFVLPHKEKVPELHESYTAACAGKVAI